MTPVCDFLVTSTCLNVMKNISIIASNVKPLVFTSIGYELCFCLPPVPCSWLSGCTHRQPYLSSQIPISNCPTLHPDCGLHPQQGVNYTTEGQTDSHADRVLSD